MQKVKVLVVDDSALVREVLTRGLNADSAIEVVGTAPDPYIARDKIVQLSPDVVTLDIEMPKMDGVEFLRHLMPNHPLPVVVVSSLTPKGGHTTLEALNAGAVDFVTKPGGPISSGLSDVMSELRVKVKVASTVNVAHWKHKLYEGIGANEKLRNRILKGSTDKVVAIGASTGGVNAIQQVVKDLPITTPGIVIVQHMPDGFTKSFADRLNGVAKMDVKEAVDDDRIMPGRVLIAPGGKQMKVVRYGGMYRVNITDDPPVNRHAPSVEYLFDSIAKNVGDNAYGVMLTGMGDDGADAMVRMRKAGAKTCAQDEKSSVVFGMPKEAYVRGGAEILVPLDRIAEKIVNAFGQDSK